jgi:hypothetical protein
MSLVPDGKGSASTGAGTPLARLSLSAIQMVVSEQ